MAVGGCIMTSREVIIRNLKRSGPDRIGMSFGKRRARDFCSVGLSPSRSRRTKRWIEGRVEYYTDEWGNTWHRLAEMGQGGEVFQAALSDWGMLESLRLPDLDNPKRCEKARRVFSRNPDKFHLAGLPGFPFAICRYLRKMEIYFQDLILERENIDRLHDRVTSLLERLIGNYAEAGADGIFFCEDWGTQERLLVSPAMWRDIFKPLYRRLCGTAHQHGLYVLMHSCGYNWDILDDLAEVGVNAFQFDQPNLYGLERLAQKLKELRVCLFAPVDIQRILPTGDRELITSTAVDMVRLFGGDDGGLIAKSYGDLHGIGVKPEWDRWAYQAFRDHRALPARNTVRPAGERNRRARARGCRTASN